MAAPRYKYIDRLVEKLVEMPTNNAEFDYYGHHILMNSGLRDYMSVNIYATTDQYSGDIAKFSFDFWTHKLCIERTENKGLRKAIIRAFRNIYDKWNTAISVDED